MNTESFYVGEWLVEPGLDRISGESARRNMRPKVMDLLVYLAQENGQVVSGEEILDRLWPGSVVTVGSVYRCIGELRNVLASNGDNRVYIETIPKKGYRLRMPVAETSENSGSDRPGRRSGLWFAVFATVSLVATLVIWHWQRTLIEPQTSELGRPSVAILAFESGGENGGDDYFADGLSEDLINRLARMPELRVISRSSSFSFKGKNVAISDIAEQLNADLIVEGSVRRAGTRIRISAQLIDARSDSHVWSRSYDRTLKHAFDVQAEVSSAIVAALKDELGLQIVVPVRPARQTTPEARDAYLRGRHLVVQRSTVAIANAAREFQTAVRLDPEFAPAHAELAIATLLLARGTYGELSESEAIRVAGPIAARALQLDPELPEAYLSVGLIEMISGRYEESLPHLHRAVALSPSNALAYSWLGSAYDRLGRYREYFEATKLALALDPLSQPSLVNHIQSLIDRDELVQAAHELEKLESVSPRAAASLRGHLTSLGGNWADAVFAKLDALQIDPESAQVKLILSERLAMLGLGQEALSVTDNYLHYPLSYLGLPDAALRRAEELHEEHEGILASRSDLAIALAGAGEFARARPLLEDIWERRGGRVTRSGLFTRDGVPIISAIALVAARRAADRDSDIRDVLSAMEDNIRRTREAGFTRTVRLLSVDFEEGFVAYISGDRERGLALIGKAAEDGYFIPPAEAYFDVLRDEPEFTDLLDKQAQRQARERARLLAIVCGDNPYASVWAPAVTTCESFPIADGH
jgi:TolB-like protein/DNA-binding winged helix-turn-helix (wHTH) protein/Tfp pilus assembly protein PilF